MDCKQEYCQTSLRDIMTLQIAILVKYNNIKGTVKIL